MWNLYISETIEDRTENLQIYKAPMRAEGKSEMCELTMSIEREDWTSYLSDKV